MKESMSGILYKGFEFHNYCNKESLYLKSIYDYEINYHTEEKPKEKIITLLVRDGKKVSYDRLL